MGRRHNPPNPIATARRFCRYHLGRDCFAPFTGQDFSAWSAFVYLCELYGRADLAGTESCIAAMEATLGASQSKVHAVFLQTIPGILDWSHAGQIWPLIAQSEARPVESHVDRSKAGAS